jgi:hypothetical protein
MIKQLDLLDTSQYQRTQTFTDWELENSKCTDSDTEFCTDSDTPSTIYKYVVSESKCTSQGAASNCTTHGTIQEYESKGSSRSTKKYFRYQWREGNRIHHRHIPGGNISDLLAKKRAALVQCEIDAGKTPSEIVAFIKGFKVLHQKR